MTHHALRTLPLAALATLALAACQNDDRTYEAAPTAEGGGELIVATPSPGEVPVDVPETEMTNVPGTGDMAPPATATPTNTPVGEPIMDTAPDE
ncbi:hypothetical protein [Qipengyuania sp.]|uniref:hypothetical protein n=1 Tax=Qipengyuania sp. TaxID=2004515 RepID=UPI0035C793F7